MCGRSCALYALFRELPSFGDQGIAFSVFVFERWYCFESYCAWTIVAGDNGLLRLVVMVPFGR